MTKWQTIPHNGRRSGKLDEVQTDWGSLDTAGHQTSIDDSDSPDTLNTMFDFDVPEKAMGYIKLITSGSLGGGIDFEFSFYKQDGTKQFLFGVNNTDPTTAPSMAAPIAPTGALAASTALGIGAYKYKITFVTAAGETQGGAELSISTTSGNQSVTLSNISPGANNVIARKIYRTVVGGASGAEKLVTTINDNTTTTYTDTVADGSLGATVPSSSTAGGATGKYLYRYDNAGGGIKIGGPYNLSGIWDADVYGDKVYFVDGYSLMQAWDGSTMTTLSLTNGQILAMIRQHKNRMYGAPRNSSLMFFTDAGDATSWPVNNFIKVETQDGEIITGIGVSDDEIIIGKTDSIHVIEGEPLGAGATTTIGNLQMHRADSDVGCVSHRSIQNIGSGIFLFASEFGIYALQNRATTNVSPKLHNTFQTDFNPNFRSNVWSVYSRTKKVYMLGYCSNASGGNPDKAIYMDMHVPGRTRISIWDDIPGGYAIEFRFNQTTGVYLSDPNRGTIYQLFQGYAHIAGDNGQSTGSNSTTTINDTKKSWTVNQFKDCKVKIMAGTGQGRVVTVVSNTATQLTVTPAMTIVPDASSIYSIGFYDGYWTTRQTDFHRQHMSKKYKYLNLYADTEGNYPLRFGVAFGGNPVAYADELSLQASAGIATWGQRNTDGSAIPWGLAGAKFGHSKNLWKQGDSSGTDRFWQGKFGTDKANQPWRVSSLSIVYKEKKGRPD